ncbi:MAG: TetR/AcrR family transcriptional regulator [Myxococcales bacterium]|nr:TetR/AcrR family transcriptional regulator [Myxococcales bacterium]HIK84242.1 TetR/AcrR family transcriptional regulator [Myxococcales bacterium]
MPRSSPKQTQPIGLRETNVEARRQRILDAARRLITRGGMNSLSMRKLAKEAGLAVATLYNLFGVREEILDALVIDAIDQMNLELNRDAPLDDPIERCRAIITVSVRHMVDREAVFRPMVIAAHQTALGTGQVRREITLRASGMQSLAIAAAIEQGLLKDLLDPTQLGRQIYHGYELASLQWGFGELDARGFEARALYGLNLALLAVAGDAIRAQLEADLRELDDEMNLLKGAAPHGTNRTTSSTQTGH